MIFTTQALANMEHLESKNMDKNFKPLSNFIHVEPIMDADIESATIVIPDTVKSPEKFGVRKGRVLAVGEGTYTKDGKNLPVNVKVGDMIVFVNYGAAEIKRDGVTTIVIREDNCLGTYQDEEIKSFKPKERFSNFPVRVGLGDKMKQRKVYSGKR